MRMPRRPRRSAIRYIEDKNSRGISFSKRRDGLFKMAANLSTLTGARIAIVVEAENGKMSGFSAPSFGPILESFLSGGEGGAPEGPDEQEKDRIAKLQNEIMQLEEKKAMQEQRAVESLARVKAFQESSRKKGKLVYSNVDDLCVDELNELLRGLARVGQEIRALFPPPPPPHRVQISGVRGPPPLPLFSPPHSQVPRRLPWVSSQLIRPADFSLTSPPVQSSSVQAMSRMLLRQTQLSQHPSLMVRPQAPGHFSQTSLLSSLPLPPPISTHQIPSMQAEIPFQALNLNPDVPSQNHANPEPFFENNEASHFFGGMGGTTANPFTSSSSQQQPALVPCAAANGGHHAPGSPSGSNGETYDWLSKTLLESSSSSQGGSSSDDDAGDNLDWFGDN